MIILLAVLALAFVPATATAASTCVIPSSGLVGWWRGDGDALDSAGTKHGSLVGGAGFASGAVGQAFTLGGVDGRLDASAPLNAGADGAIKDDDGEGEVTLFSRALTTAELAGMSACRVPPTFEVGISCPATLRRLPAGARAGAIVSVGLGVFGRVGTDARRRLLGTDTCLIEVTR